jgi:hypothetical protein
VRQRLDQVDTFGNVHRPDCPMDAWDEATRVAGVYLYRCSGCGVVRLWKATT